MIITEKDIRRFWSKVALPNEQGCMLWLTPLTTGGYAQFTLGGKSPSAHRVSYTLAYGPIPEGLSIDHVKARGCTNRHCMAPDHLEAVTHLENVRRGNSGALERAQTHCKHGHLFDEKNTYIRRNGTRKCRECGVAYVRAQRVAQKSHRLTGPPPA